MTWAQNVFDVLAYVIDVSWESVEDHKYYHTRFNVGTDLKSAQESFYTIAYKGIPVREDNSAADGWVILFGVTSWNRGDNDGPIMVKLDSHEWTHA